MRFLAPIWFIVLVLLMASSTAWAIVSPNPQEIRGLDVLEKFGTQVDPDWTFTDFEGTERKIGEFFDSVLAIATQRLQV